jgi:hypothetical protein
MVTKIVGTGLDLSGQRIQNLGDGSGPADAVTKAQLDAIARGLDWKASVRVATTAAITLSGTQTIDGVAVVAGDRVLVKDQASAPTNGVYVVAAGAWARATDFDDSTEVTAAAAVPIEAGTTNGDAVFILTTDGTITVGTTALAFSRLGGSGVSYTAGNGLQLSGSAFSVKPKTSGGIVVDADGVSIDQGYTGLAKRYSVNVPTSTSATITHNLGTLDVLVEVVEVSTGATVEADVVRTNTNVVTLGFAVAPSSGQYRATVIG